MSYQTVFQGPERRRRWSDADRRRILTAAFAPGAVVVRVARENDVATGLIYKWRQELRASAGFAVEPLFSPVVLSGAGPRLPAAAGVATPAILVELAGGARVSISATAPAALASAVLRALR